MISPVLGFRAAGLGLVSFTSKTPKPLISIRLFSIRLSRIASNRASTIRVATFFLQPVLSATESAKCFLVVVILNPSFMLPG